jgi:hypothetical protein
MPLPATESLKNNANEFENIWNFPYVIGCLDIKHIHIVCPTDSGAAFFNYKKYFSVLQWLVDANYKFITVDMGAFGKQSNGCIFLASDLFSFIGGKRLSFPEPDFLPHSNVTAPYIILGDGAYPLLHYLMKPYEPNSLTDRRHSFNECLSRARKTVECAFRNLYSKWCIISKAIKMEVELVHRIVKCICCLHNTIVKKSGFERHLTDITVQSKFVAWERRGRLPTETKNLRDLFSLYRGGGTPYDIIKK